MPGTLLAGRIGGWLLVAAVRIAGLVAECKAWRRVLLRCTFHHGWASRWDAVDSGMVAMAAMVSD
jgi:hypothetical protein